MFGRELLLAALILVPVTSLAKGSDYENYVYKEEVSSTETTVYSVLCQNIEKSTCSLNSITVATGKAVSNCYVISNPLLERVPAKREKNGTWTATTQVGGCNESISYTFAATGMTQVKTSATKFSKEQIEAECKSYEPKVTKAHLMKKKDVEVSLGECKKTNVLIIDPTY
jgi:hypothetical protein